MRYGDGIRTTLLVLVIAVLSAGCQAERAERRERDDAKRAPSHDEDSSRPAAAGSDAVLLATDVPQDWGYAGDFRERTAAYGIPGPEAKFIAMYSLRARPWEGELSELEEELEEMASSVPGGVKVDSLESSRTEVFGLADCLKAGADLKMVGPAEGGSAPPSKVELWACVSQNTVYAATALVMTKPTPRIEADIRRLVAGTKLVDRDERPEQTRIRDCVRINTNFSAGKLSELGIARPDLVAAVRADCAARAEAGALP